MSLASISLKRPVLAIVMSITIVLFGIIGFKSLGIRDYPAIDPPVITVSTNYTGANADVMESQITEPLEQSINGIDGIRDISSTSSQGVSKITVEFDLGADLETAANDVRDKVSHALRLLPANIDAPPVVTKSDANAGAILAMTVQSNTKSQLQICDFAENVIEQQLQTIPGVSMIQVWGEQLYAMRLRLNPSKMAAYGVTALDVQAALTAQNVQLPAGQIEGNTTELTVETKGLLATAEDFDNMIIKTDSKNVIRLKDIGYAQLGAQNEETILKSSGTPMIGLGLVPQPGANYVDISKAFYARLAQIKKNMPKDYTFKVALDETKFINQSISEVEETLLISFALVIIIILLFFRDFLIALRPLIDIPVSLIGVFFIMDVAGFSINILTLLAVVLATGLVVDDGIVVTENIYKKIEQGMPPLEAAEKGSEEIYFAVISTSLTLAVVFLPIVFLPGFTGRLFREFGVVVAGAVLISAFVSLSLTPVLNVLMSRKKKKKNTFYEKTEPFFVWMNTFYHEKLTQFMKRRWVAFVIIAACVGAIYFIGNNLHSELAPLDDKSVLRIISTAPEGSSYEYMNHYMDQITQLIDDSIPEKQFSLTLTAPPFFGTGSVNTGFTRLVLVNPEDRTRTQNQIANYLSQKLKAFPDAHSVVIQEQTIAVGSAKTGMPIQYVLQAVNFETLRKELPPFLAAVKADPVFKMVDVDLKFNKPELDMTIDRDKAQSMGVSIMNISQTIQAALSGQVFGYFLHNGKQYEIIGQLDREYRDQPIDLKSMYVKNNKGVSIELDNLVKIKEESAPPALYHYNRYESATVSAALAPGKTTGDGIAEMDKIAKKVLGPNITTALNGASRDYAESSSSISFAFALALMLIYLVLAAQFESFIDPLIIMVTVPLAIAGAVISLWYFNQTLNIFSEIGIIVLVGLVTKNGILIVEFANQRKEQGLSVMEAVIDASTGRLRPILMTTLAMALGALPIALALGAGSKSRISLGIVIIGGLMFALVLTLFVIPAIYSFFSKEIKKENVVSSENKFEA
ncbi:MAG TPA: efflux RND transporter permease subunit [Bacteroidia bacterium]|nr:efflux RND transporter permease subunit [Bacteroidia bacterium]